MCSGLMPMTSSVSLSRAAAARIPGERGMTAPARVAPPSVSGAFSRFIAGEPMKPATNWFTGLSYSSRGDAHCWR